MHLDVVADLVLAALLLLTAAWCALVHQRLRRLRTERGEMEAFIATLAAATERAEEATAGLRGVVAEAERGLHEQGSAARQRAAELARLLESGSRMLRRLETAVHGGARSLAEQGLPRERVEPETTPAAAAAGESRTRRSAEGDRATSLPSRPVRSPTSSQGVGGLSAGELAKVLGSLR